MAGLSAKHEDPCDPGKVHHSLTSLLRSWTYTMAAERALANCGRGPAGRPGASPGCIGLTWPRPARGERRVRLPVDALALARKPDLGPQPCRPRGRALRFGASGGAGDAGRQGARCGDAERRLLPVRDFWVAAGLGMEKALRPVLLPPARGSSWRDGALARPQTAPRKGAHGRRCGEHAAAAGRSRRGRARRGRRGARRRRLRGAGLLNELEGARSATPSGCPQARCSSSSPSRTSSARPVGRPPKDPRTWCTELRYRAATRRLPRIGPAEAEIRSRHRF